MAAVFRNAFTVPDDAIDQNGHVSNIAFVAWMQDVAIMHSSALGWTPARYESTGGTWVVRSHFVEYLEPAFAGDQLVRMTWVSDFRRIRSCRKYKFVRADDERPVIRAETQWVFVDAATGRPRSVPPELVADFPLVPVDKEP